MSEVAAPVPAPPARRALSVNLTVRTLLLVSAVAALAWAFVSIRDAMLTVFLALFAALVLEPVVRLMERHLPFGRGACATILVLGLLTVTIVFVLLLLAPLAGSFRNFVDQLPSIVADIKNNSSLGKWINEHSSAPETAQGNVKQIAQAIGDAAGGVLGIVVSGFSLVLSGVTAIFLTLFLMIDLQRLIGAVDSLLAPTQSDAWNRVSERIITAVSRTMLGNIAISIICGTIYGVSCWLLGTPFPVVMGVIAGLLDLIPMVGATIAGTILVLANADAGPDAGADHARDRARLPAVRELRPAADDPRQGGQRLRVLRDLQRDDLRGVARRRRSHHRRPDHRLDPDRGARGDGGAAGPDGRLTRRRRGPAT